MHHVRLLIVPFSFVFLKGWNSLRGRNVCTAFALVLICCSNITRIALDVRHYLQHRYRCLTWLRISPISPRQNMIAFMLWWTFSAQFIRGADNASPIIFEHYHEMSISFYILQLTSCKCCCSVMRQLEVLIVMSSYAACHFWLCIVCSITTTLLLPPLFLLLFWCMGLW